MAVRWVTVEKLKCKDRQRVTLKTNNKSNQNRDWRFAVLKDPTPLPLMPYIVVISQIQKTIAAQAQKGCPGTQVTTRFMQTLLNMM